MERDQRIDFVAYIIDLCNRIGYVKEKNLFDKVYDMEEEVLFTLFTTLKIQSNRGSKDEAVFETLDRFLNRTAIDSFC